MYLLNLLFLKITLEPFYFICILFYLYFLFIYLYFLNVFIQFIVFF